MANKLHSDLLKKVMNAPNNLYFDVTPVGKLLGNFTADIGRCDRAFFWHINWVLDTMADFLLKISFAIYYSPYMLIAILINLYLLYGLQDFTKNGKTECNRMQKKFNKKLSSHFSETFDGLTQVRAFG